MNYHNILKNDMVNGDGLRVVLFVSGCSHFCKGCQNPQTWNKNSGILFDDAAKQEIFEELSKPYISGITLSGGDPLFKNNREPILQLCKEIKQKFTNKTIWLYSGFVYDQIKDLEVLNYVDVLCDGKFEEQNFDKNKKWVGSTNQRVIDVAKTKQQNKIVLFCE